MPWRQGRTRVRYVGYAWGRGLHQHCLPKTGCGIVHRNCLPDCLGVHSKPHTDTGRGGNSWYVGLCTGMACPAQARGICVDMYPGNSTELVPSSSGLKHSMACPVVACPLMVLAPKVPSVSCITLAATFHWDTTLRLWAPEAFPDTFCTRP